MAYQALLFCPEEKTARTVTQVLSELEFSVEPCSEPFAAVKKLMSQHFDAVVVDCDNEQNATLLFKSARNSTSNQASLAVAIVEGQAGVAKAFRIGANLVLTKPINVEQSKGTLRVARGLLRKGEPVKPAAAPVSAPPAPVAAAPILAPAKPPAPKPVSAVKPQAPVAPPIVPSPSSPAPTIAKPAPATTQARTAVAKAAPPSVIPASKPVAPPVPPVPLAPPVPQSTGETTAAKVQENSVVPASASAKPVFAVAPETTGRFSGGAASAPAPARETKTEAVEADSPEQEAHAERKPHAAEDLFEKPAETATPEPSVVAASSDPSPSFTFGGANEPEESTGMGMKIVLIAALLLIVVGAYAGWNYFQGQSTHSEVRNTPAAGSNPAAVPPVPVSSQPKPSAAPAVESTTEAKNSTADLPKETSTVPEYDAQDSAGSSATSTKTGNAIPSASKSTVPAKPEPEPLIVKGGSAPVIHRAITASDSSAPSVMAIATPGSDGALSAIAGGNEATPVPVLQSLNISQGVSQGLITKRVQPVYPKAALTMHIEGAVELTATISKAGVISAVKVLKGDPQLSRAAVDAVKQWKYKPYLLNGEPVEIQTQITVNFKLPN